MRQKQQIDIVFTVLDGKEIPVYGIDLLQHILADGERMQLAMTHVPIGRAESAEVLEAYFAARRSVLYADVQKAALQVPGIEVDMAMRDIQNGNTK